MTSDPDSPLECSVCGRVPDLQERVVRGSGEHLGFKACICRDCIDEGLRALAQGDESSIADGAVCAYCGSDAELCGRMFARGRMHICAACLREAAAFTNKKHRRLAKRLGAGVTYIDVGKTTAAAFASPLVQIIGWLVAASALWLLLGLKLAAQVGWADQNPVTEVITPAENSPLGVVFAATLVLPALAILFSHWRVRARRISPWNISQNQLEQRVRLLWRRRQGKRRTILYLRSFSDDNWAIPLDSDYSPETLEVAIAREARRRGRFVAIGQPNTARRAGAKRSYVNDAEWRAKVTSLMEEASLIVVLASYSSGLSWELQAAIARDHANKMLILFPPNARDHLARWESAIEAFAGTPTGKAMHTASASGVVGVSHDEVGKVLVFRASGPRPEHLRLAFQCALYAMLGGDTPRSVVAVAQD